MSSGFIQDVTASAASNTMTTSNASGLSVTFDYVEDGDLLFYAASTTSLPGNAMTTPSGWTQLGNQKNGASSFGGRFACFYKVWHTGDSLTVTTTHGGSAPLAVGIVVRSTTAGGSLSIGNPPSGGMTSGYDAETTATGTTATAPRIQVDDTAKNLRMMFVVTSAAGAASYVPAQSATNLFRKQPLDTVASPSATPQLTALVGLGSLDPAGMDAGTTTWTVPNGKTYAFGFAVSDPNATTDGPSIGYDVGPGETATPEECVSLEYIVTVTQAGGGGSITVF